MLDIYGINNKHAVRAHEIYELYEYIIKNISTLFKQQYSSRVVDKAVDTMPREYIEKVCSAIKNNPNKKQKLFKEIMLDQYGNYLAPRLIENAKKNGLIKHSNYFIDTYNNSLDVLKKK